MDVILLERVENLGQMGQVVKVKNGFARNYLLPRRKALRATEANRSVFESQRAQLVAVNLEKRKEAEQVAQKLDGLKVTLIRQAGDGGQLYGSVSVRDVAAAISEAGITVDRRQVQLDRPIKMLGLHDLRVVLHPEVSVTVTANVARSDDEAAAQARGETVIGRDAFADEDEDEYEKASDVAEDEGAERV